MVPQVDLDVVIGGHSHTLLFGDENGDLEGFDEQDEEDNIKGSFWKPRKLSIQNYSLGNYPSVETNIDGKVEDLVWDNGNLSISKWDIVK